jgi:hypothetical protein
LYLGNVVERVVRFKVAQKLGSENLMLVEFFPESGGGPCPGGVVVRNLGYFVFEGLGGREEKGDYGGGDAVRDCGVCSWGDGLDVVVES